MTLCMQGRLVHIDFGFILEISPGGNLGFENAAFKMSHEMCQLLDPSGRRESVHFRAFAQRVVQGFLVVSTCLGLAEWGACCRLASTAAWLSCRLHSIVHMEMRHLDIASLLAYVDAAGWVAWRADLCQACCC